MTRRDTTDRKSPLPDHYRSIILAAAMVLALGGCFGETVIDTRSGDALKESVARISEDQTPKERKRFAAAMKTLTEAHREEGRSMDDIAEILAPQIGGKTPAEAIAAADAWVAAEKKRVAKLEQQSRLADLEAQIKEYTVEISRLETVIVDQRANANSIRTRLDLANARYFWRESNAETYPLIDVELTNNHDRPIRTIVIAGRLFEKGSDKPIIEGKLRYEFRSNLKPGNRARMRFEPDLFGEWGNTSLKDREDLTLKLDVENLTYPDGVELVRTFVFRGDDPTFKVESLKRRLGEANAEREILLGKTRNS